MEQTSPSEPLSMLKLEEVKDRVKLGTSTIYRYMDNGEFPRPVKLGNSVRWYEHEINAYLKSLPRVEPGSYE